MVLGAAGKSSAKAPACDFAAEDREAPFPGLLQ